MFFRQSLVWSRAIMWTIMGAAVGLLLWACLAHMEEVVHATGKLEPLSAGPGEQKNPVVLATADGNFAMGIFAPPQNQPDTRGPGFGRFDFPGARVVKWNCVYRVRNYGVIRGDYSYRMLVPVGTLAQVEVMLRDWRDLKW